MSVSSYCKRFSVEIAALIIGTLHMILSLSGLIIVCYKTLQFELIISLMIQFLSSILLLHGVLQRTSSYIFPFLCAYFANITVVIPIYYFHNILNAIYTSAPVQPYLILTLIVIFAFALSIYFFKVIYGLYQKLLREKYSLSSPIVHSTVVV